MEIEEIRHLVVGLDVYKAKNKILSLCENISEEDIDITYYESEYRRYIVTDCKKVGRKIMLYSTSKNPVRYLPSIYQENDFLRKFLMIFQHVNNEIGIKIDNINEMFRPMHCPADFLKVLSEWFGIDIDLLGTEQQKRLFLQYAIPLFKLRGTRLGIKIILYIMTGIVPEIIEDYIPFSSIEVNENNNVNGNILEKTNGNSVFTIYFPVYREEFDENLIKRIMLMMQQEKPVNTDCYISFKKNQKKKREYSVITDNNSVGSVFEI